MSMYGGSHVGRLDRQRSVRSRVMDDNPGKLSVRSKGSSVSSENRVKMFRDCCRALLEFLFTQVGVGALVVCYTIAGALAFQSIETLEQHDLIAEVHETRAKTVTELWNVTNTFNILNSGQWSRQIRNILKHHQDSMVTFIKDGYDGQRVEERWTFPASLMFALSVITMIGYGNMVPRTDWGKIATMIYALIGIPVYALYFMNVGKVFANLFKWIYRKLYSCTTKKKLEQYNSMLDEDGEEQPQVMIPSTACVWVMLAYLLTGTIMFAEWEGWNYLDSVYFCVTSLCKIGLGDFVPGTNFKGQDGEMNKVKLIINFVYLLVGMGVVAMNYYLLEEEVALRVEKLKKKALKLCSSNKNRQ